MAIPRIDQPDRLQIAGDPIGSGIAVANGVCYFSTSMSQQLVAVDANSGESLTSISLEEPAWSGPSVSRGRVYIGTGSVIFEPWAQQEPEEYRFNFPTAKHGAIYSFGLPGDDDVDLLPETEK